MTIPKYEQILNWDIEERDGKKFVIAHWTEEEFEMVNGDLRYPPILTKTYELNDPNCKWILYDTWDTLKLKGEINPNIDFESWLTSIDYKEYIEKFAMPGVDSVTESEVDDDLPF